MSRSRDLERLLTLRVIPDNFQSLLFERDRKSAAGEAVGWDLSRLQAAPSGATLTPALDARLRLSSASDAPIVSHSADRLAGAIVLATRSARDPRTLTDWGRQVGVSRGALRVWCKAAGVSARACLDFLRVLRAVVRSRNQKLDLLSMLDVVDRRSLLNLLDRGGVRALCRDTQPTVDEFLRRQRFFTNREVVQAARQHLDAEP